MSGRDLEEYVKGIEKDSEERRAAGKPPVGDTSIQGDVERQEDAFDVPSGSGTKGRGASHPALTQSARVSKPARSSSGRTEQPGITRSGLSERSGRGSRRQSAVSRSQTNGTGAVGEGQVQEVQGRVDRMSIND
jgi:hypothetical protein